MKNSCLILLLLVGTNGWAQQRLSFTAIVGGNYTTSKAVENKFTTVQHGLLNRDVDTFYLQKNYFHYTVKSSYKGKTGFNLGLNANYQATEKLKLSIGLAFSSFGFTRVNKLINTSVSDPIYLRVVYHVPPGTQFFSIPGLETSENSRYAGYYYQVSEEVIEVTALKIPLEAAFQLLKSKVDLRVGLVPVILLNYRVTPNEKIDFEGFPLRLSQSENKFNLTASVGIGFPLYKDLTGDISYQQYFKTITEGKLIPALTPQVINFSLHYKIPKIKGDE